MIEKVIHQIWVGGFKIPLREQQLSEQLKALHPDYEYKLWREAESLPPNVQYWYDIFYERKNFAFCADLLRVWVVYKYGGFYLDIDFDIKKRLDPFFEQDAAFFYHNDTDFTVPNNIFASKSGSDILKFFLENVKPECSWYGPSWMGQMVKDYLHFPYEIPQAPVMEALNKQNIIYHQYYAFELEYGRHLSLYSWEPKTWTKLNNNEQL